MSLGWLAALLSSGCGPTTIEDLSRPALVVVVEPGGGFCASVYAVDESNTLWGTSGCEPEAASLTSTERTISSAERTALDARMDEVLALSDDPECDVVNPTGRRFRFVRTGSGSVDEWPSIRQCDPGVPIVAQDLAEQLRRLVGPVDPADAGADASM